MAAVQPVDASLRVGLASTVHRLPRWRSESLTQCGGAALNRRFGNRQATVSVASSSGQQAKGAII